MINKYFNYDAKRYKKLVKYDIVSIILTVISVILFLLFIMVAIGDEEGMSYVFAFAIFLSILPLAFFCMGNLEKKNRLLDTWLLDNNGDLFYVYINGNFSEHSKIKNDLSQKELLELIYNSRKANNYYSVYKINNINNLVEYKNYLKIDANFLREIDNKEILKTVYVMKELNNYEEFLLLIKSKR